MSVRVVPLTEVTDADVARWRRLAARAVEPNAFMEPEFLLNIAPAWPDSSEVRLAVLEDGDEWRAVLAFSIDTLTLVRMRVPVVKVPGSFMRSATGRQYPLIDGDDPERRMGELFRGLRATGLPGVLEFGVVPGDGRLFDALHAVTRRRGLPVMELQRDLSAYAYAPEPPPEDSAHTLARGAHLSRKRRLSMRRDIRDIEGIVGEPLRHVDRSADPGVVDPFIALQASGWKGDAAAGGRAIATVPGYREAFVTMTNALRAQNRLRVDTLEAGGILIHVACAMRASGGGWFALLDAYDEHFRAQGPGNIGRLAQFNAVSEQGSTDTYDPCMASHNASVFALYPDVRPYVYVIVGYGSAAARSRLRVVSRLWSLRGTVGAARSRGAT